MNDPEHPRPSTPPGPRREDRAPRTDPPSAPAAHVAEPRNSEPPARRARAAAGSFLREITYPHDIHPALVPGVSVEDQKIRYGIDRPILLTVGALIIAFVIWGVIAPLNVFEVSTAGLNWVMQNLGWIFTAIAIGMVVFLLVLAFTRYGRIPLGLDGEKPQYSTPSWAAMLFGAGIGIGIIFFGPFEPMTYYLSPRPGSYDAGSIQAITGAMAQAALHWGINAWAIYAIVGLAVAYVSYRRGRVPLMSSVLQPLIGGTSSSLGHRVIDGLAIIATLFGTAASLGIGALQIGQGFTLVTGWGEGANAVALVIIVVLTIGTIMSAVSGVAKGIRWLSNINMALAIALAVFIFVVGPTAFLANVIPGVLMDYIGSIPAMLSANMGDGPEMQQFLSSWTTFYWAWWVSWAPFVGVFTAKISRGRTVRQFIVGVLTIPSSIVVLAFTILGGTSIWLQRQASIVNAAGNTTGVANPDGAIAPDGTIDSMPAAPEIFFRVIEHLPGAAIITPIVMVMLAIFFITTADSASLVNSQLSQKGNPAPHKLVTVFWALCMAGIAVVILLAGGQNALQGLQNLITITALPFAVIIIAMCVALYKEMRTDPLMIRTRYAGAAVAKAVRHGVQEHGDNFALAIEPTDAESPYATGGDFDSTADDVIDWYVRRDEDGNVIDYDYETGTYPGDADGKPTDAQEVAAAAPSAAEAGSDGRGEDR